jgi:hypothetical protein
MGSDDDTLLPSTSSPETDRKSSYYVKNTFTESVCFGVSIKPRMILNKLAIITMVFHSFLNPSRKMLQKLYEAGHGCFLPHVFKFSFIVIIPFLTEYTAANIGDTALLNTSNDHLTFVGIFDSSFFKMCDDVGKLWFVIVLICIILSLAFGISTL